MICWYNNIQEEINYFSWLYLDIDIYKINSELTWNPKPQMATYSVVGTVIDRCIKISMEIWFFQILWMA